MVKKQRILQSWKEWINSQKNKTDYEGKIK